MNNSVSHYSTSPGAFQQRCQYLWHRQFTSPEQKTILEERQACLVTYVEKHEMPFGNEVSTIEQTVMKMVLNVTGDAAADLLLLSILVRTMKPDSFEISLDDDTFRDERAVLVLWWRTRRFPIEVDDVPVESVTTNCIKVHEDDPGALAKVRSQLGNGPLYIYGESPFLVTDVPLTQEHAKLLLDMKH